MAEATCLPGNKNTKNITKTHTTHRPAACTCFMSIVCYCPSPTHGPTVNTPILNHTPTDARAITRSDSTCATSRQNLEEKNGKNILVIFCVYQKKQVIKYKSLRISWRYELKIMMGMYKKKCSLHMFIGLY